MDSLIVHAARVLAAGDMLVALKQVALRNDPPALALRGIAMAQLGELQRARELLRRAVRGFGPREPLAHARCVVAEAEVALALRDLGSGTRALAAAVQALEERADHANALHARLIQTRRLLLLGRLEQAALVLRSTAAIGIPAATVAVACLAEAELALRSLRPADARGDVIERLQMPAGTGVSGLESDGRGLFYCGGGGSGKVRAVRRPKRAA